MGKYNFSVTRQNRLKHYMEELQVTGCDSFDEARKVVEKAVHDRELFEAEEMKKNPPLNGLMGSGTLSRPGNIVAAPGAGSTFGSTTPKDQTSGQVFPPRDDTA